MASPTPKRTSFESRYPPRPAAGAPEVVDPVWLLKALGIALLAATILGYLSVCMLIFQGGWQRMLSPSRAVKQTPAIPFQPVSFDTASTGRPRLTGWYLPSPAPASLTILFLHGGTGSLADTVPVLTLLHQAKVNIFAIDYRGFGQSDPIHPNEVRMNEDAFAALSYLTETRHIPTSVIVPYGQGLGAVLAANLVHQQPELPALIVDTPDPEAYAHVVSDDRSRLLPMRLLIRDHFDIASALGSSPQPKLLLTNSCFGADSAHLSANQHIFLGVPGKKLTVTFAAPHSETLYLQAISRFLDQYVPKKGS